MTTKEKVIGMMVERGMFPEQAETVFSAAKEKLAEFAPNYHITWDRPASEYPAPVYAAMWLTVKDEALKWIDENKPQAWFRAMFA
jgi:hypothetical protein